MKHSTQKKVKAWAKIWLETGEIYKVMMPWEVVGDVEAQFGTKDHVFRSCTITYHV